MTFALGREANGWNEVARGDWDLAGTVRRTFMNLLIGERIAETSSAEFKILTAITARTLRFRKFAEAISVEQFRNGLRDHDGDLLSDEDGPYFAGCNISKDETVSRAIQGLETNDLITRWPPARRGWSAVYMPFSEEWLAGQVVFETGGLPHTYNRLHSGQILNGPNGLVRVEGGPLSSVKVQPVNNHLHANAEPLTISMIDEHRLWARLSPAKVRSAQGLSPRRRRS